MKTSGQLLVVIAIACSDRFASGSFFRRQSSSSCPVSRPGQNTVTATRTDSAAILAQDHVIVAAIQLSSEGGSLMFRRDTATAFQTGPLLGATADSAGYQLLFGRGNQKW